MNAQELEFAICNSPLSLRDKAIACNHRINFRIGDANDARAERAALLENHKSLYGYIPKIAMI